MNVHIYCIYLIFICLQVLRVFGGLKFYEPRVIEKLLERDKGTGIIAMYVFQFVVIDRNKWDRILVV